jgi:hypothetical protein
VSMAATMAASMVDQTVVLKAALKVEMMAD